MPLNKCEVNFDLIWSKKCVIVANDITNQGVTFTIIDTKLSVLVVTSSTQDNAKLLDQLKSGLKKINRNEYLSKISTDIPNQYLDYLINPSFQKVNRLFVLSFENNTQREI